MTSDPLNRPTLRVMADYGCNPLWLPATFDNPSPADVVSPALAVRLSASADELDATLDRQDGRNSGFPDEQLQRDFEARGLELARVVAAEVGGRFTVRFKPWSRPEVVLS